MRRVNDLPVPPAAGDRLPADICAQTIWQAYLAGISGRSGEQKGRRHELSVGGAGDGAAGRTAGAGGV